MLLNFFKRPLVVSLSTFAVVFAGVWGVGCFLTGGHAIYPLDDTYIHISLARQLAETGTWGVAPGEYAFCSSSPLWTVILALGYWLLGIQPWLPGLLAMVGAAAALVFADRFWREMGFSVRARIGCGVLLTLVVPLAVMAHLGMEHALHTAFMVALAGAVVRVLGGDESRRTLWAVCIAAAVATGLRYETLFLVGPLVCLLFWERRFRIGFIIGAAAAVPVVLYGVYAYAHMGHFLPTTLLIKGCMGLTHGVLDDVYNLVAGAKGQLDVHVVLLLMATTAAFPQVASRIRKLALVGAVAVCAQIILAGPGTSLYRYEAYLVALGVLVATAGMWPLVRSASWGVRLLALVLLVPLLGRAVLAHGGSARAPREIQCQQVQLARIFSSLPEQEKGTVAINDLGYLSLHAGCPLLDLWGLGSWDVAEMLLNRKDTPYSAIYQAAMEVHKARYVAVFDDWYPRSQLPPKLRLVAKLVSACPRVACGGSVVALYAVNDVDEPTFRAHLKRIEPTLPKRTRLFFNSESQNRKLP